MARSLAALVPAVGSLCALRRHASCEETTLPSWLKVSVAKDPSRKEKIESYNAAQVTPAALKHNAAVRPKGSSTTRLVSYNLHFHRDSQMQPNLERVLDVLKALDADVLALQEAALPPSLETDGRPRVDAEPTEVQSLDVETQTRQLLHGTQQAVLGYGPAGPHEGNQLLEGLRNLGYNYCIYSPGFFSGAAKCHCGNMVASRYPFEGQVLVLDRDRFKEERSAAVATFRNFGEDSLTVAATHLDVWAEMRGFFGMAEGEAIRLLEFEALHHAVSGEGHLAILGDFNSPSQSTVTLSQEHQRLSDLLDHLSMQRDPQALRHFMPRSSPRLPQEMTALGFAEKLGYRHAWQMLPKATAPYYSHWSGQLIDHCLLKSSGTKQPRVVFAGIYHSNASDHLPLVVDLEL